MTWMVVLFLLLLSLSSAAAVVCGNSNDQCKQAFAAPQTLVLCGCCCVVVFALATVELQAGGVGNEGRFPPVDQRQVRDGGLDVVLPVGGMVVT